MLENMKKIPDEIAMKSQNLENLQKEQLKKRMRKIDSNNEISKKNQIRIKEKEKEKGNTLSTFSERTDDAKSPNSQEEVKLKMNLLIKEQAEKMKSNRTLNTKVNFFIGEGGKEKKTINSNN